MTSALANSNLETPDPMIEIFSEKVCELDVIKFAPFESDLEDAIKDKTIENLMNNAFIECDYIDTKFVLVSWDVGRAGLWYGIERFGTRSQFQSMSIKWLNGKGRVQTYSVINYDNEQCPGSKCYFQTLTGKCAYYCVILAIGSYNDCMLALKKYEDLTLHFP